MKNYAITTPACHDGALKETRYFPTIFSANDGVFPSLPERTPMHHHGGDCESFDLSSLPTSGMVGCDWPVHSEL